MYYLPLYGLVTTRYKIRAKDTQNLYSDYSEEIVSKNEPLGKEQLSDGSSAVLEYKLGNNYPNPFNPTTTIQYVMKEAGWVSVKVYDVLGSEVAVLVNSKKEPGYYNVIFDASNLPSGIYIYTLQANGFTDSKKMLLLK